VFLLGASRAIPRNYYHVVVDEMPYWLNQSYDSLLIRAVHEAPLKHAFVTQYAGDASIMHNALVYSGRYGDPATLSATGDPRAFVSTLGRVGFVFDNTLLAILSKYIPEPDGLVQQGITLYQFYNQFGFYYSQYLAGGDGGAPPTFDPVACTSELEARVVQPMQATQALFDTNPYLTRLYTVLSPEDMTADPVFSENPDLPRVGLAHSATVTYPCKGSPWLDSDQDLSVQYPSTSPSMPAAMRIEELRESGQPIVVTDNTAAITAALGTPVKNTDTGGTSSTMPQPSGSSRGCACDLSATRTQIDAGLLLFAAVVLLARRRYSMRRSPRL
jgi:hypothetical protein